MAGHFSSSNGLMRIMGGRYPAKIGLDRMGVGQIRSNGPGAVRRSLFHQSSLAGT
ncbi:hypothetical protein [Sphingomonas sp. IC4-52]|uniref:hypothetical protein n=1 Tax=Sphingomonas sp. IC4-52 TaxID=2887202 RepID=UPI001D129962|nr:hypothetical protein [Sphingomonas sp. IC4-52]MCC2979101.1 hypothetical protein [Sphingomonas sp. IC4-52]